MVVGDAVAATSNVASTTALSAGLVIRNRAEGLAVGEPDALREHLERVLLLAALPGRPALPIFVLAARHHLVLEHALADERQVAHRVAGEHLVVEAERVRGLSSRITPQVRIGSLSSAVGNTNTTGLSTMPQSSRIGAMPLYDLSTPTSSGEPPTSTSTWGMPGPGYRIGDRHIEPRVGLLHARHGLAPHLLRDRPARRGDRLADQVRHNRSVRRVALRRRVHNLGVQVEVDDATARG